MIGPVIAVIDMSSGKDDGGTGEDEALIISSQILEIGAGEAKTLAGTGIRYALLVTITRVYLGTCELT